MNTQQRQTDVIAAGNLRFGAGSIGEFDDLQSPESSVAFARQLARHTRPLSEEHALTADCGDGRRTVALGDGTTDPEVLENRIVPQVFGGPALAAARAMAAAGAGAVHDAPTMKVAYAQTAALLPRVGLQNGGHAACGASAGVKSSVEHALSAEVLVPVIEQIAGGDAVEAIVRELLGNKQKLLAAGFYDGWEPADHERQLRDTVPANFSELETAHDATHGHHEACLYLITKPWDGFAKNAFIAETGRQVFVITLPYLQKLAHELGGSETERRRIYIALLDDALNVAAGIIKPGMPVFVQQAA